MKQMKKYKLIYHKLQKTFSILTTGYDKKVYLEMIELGHAAKL